MFNPLEKRYTSIRKAKKTFKKYVWEDFPRWWLYKDKYMKLLRYPFTVPSKWEWLRNSYMFYEFERSFATRYLFWKEETIDNLHKQGLSLF
jgi:hypothetical protein